MNRPTKIVFGSCVGAVIGFLIPYGASMLNALPFLNGETNYETVLGYMFCTAIGGAIFGGLFVFQKIRNLSDLK